ncbi:MAG: polyprenyl diphosphate synthase [bacterium JZ-2024 1]
MSPDDRNNGLPVHLAIVMDGNGRWARARGLSRVEGHRKGAEVARVITQECARIGIKFLSLFAFSTDNWSRPRSEVEALFLLLKDYLRKERRTLTDNGIAFRAIGNLSELPEDVLALIADTERDTRHLNRMHLVLALNYSGQWDILQATRHIVQDALSGKITPNTLTYKRFESYLSTADLPPPDLLIRTSGECRISNFYLYPLAYTELYFTPTLWPDFTVDELGEALEEYRRRERRFGRIPEPQQL